MTLCDAALQRLVLTSCGEQEAVGSLVGAAAPALAEALGVRRQQPVEPLDAVVSLGRLAPMDTPLDTQADAPAGAGSDPGRATAQGDATAGTSGRWLLALPVDPGLALPGGGSWAESLGAWRLPVLLLLSPAHLASGWPAAADALLRRWRVPVAGLLQWGGRWDDESRQRDGLPWLGRAEGPGEELDAALLRLRLRCRDLAER